MSNNLVAYSRAGDVFHYRWAARRCLRLIYPNSCLTGIYIEGSSEPEKAGEYVIDVSEYSTLEADRKKIDYYQLKHTTVQGDEPFTISDLKDTFTGFAKRYLQHKKENKSDISAISFTIITNRKFADSFKANLSAIVEMEKVGSVFKKAIEDYTKLSNDDLVSFCRIINLEDGEGNYNIQKDELRIELAQLIAGSVENAQIDNLVALVQEKVLPDADGRINREDVLKRFGITSEKELYPAPAKWDEFVNIIERRQHAILKDRIASLSHPAIVHAAGGVGKSVFCRQLINSLPEGSLGIAYDCFGAGSYRNRSESRHKHRDALVQIANELASKGLCDPLIVQNTTLDEDIMRKFLQRLETSVKSLKKVTDSAQLFILVDAADNAEMAANEYSQSCFAHELLRENMPDGCKLVLLCRTERIYLLQPQSFIVQLELEPFSEEETLANLIKWFPEAIEKDGAEFHRLTSGNPRVQANALDVKYDSVHELLTSLGPSATSVEKQIELQLNAAISKIKDLIPQEHHHHINSICLGLASLPPHIPIDVLSKAAKVSVDHVKSFVSDIGRSLWLYDTSIQFRDEPTETWFRDTFLATKENYQGYITALEPLAHQVSYVAEVLPQLYLQSGQYDKLIAIALSDDFLPENNPIDARNVRVYRLQFAFKAALKLKNFKDAIKLAMRAGEEVAGNQRQLALFRSNIDLLTTLQSKEKVQEIAFKRLLYSGWDGSENVYSASLLSGISDYIGEGRGYLRAAMNWLYIQFEEQKKKGDHYNQDGVEDEDVLELAYAHLNIRGVSGCTDFLFGLKPKEALFRTVQDLAERLVDLGRFDEINDLTGKFIREPYYLVAIVSRLVEIGRFPQASEIETCLNLLCSRKSRIERAQNSFNDRITPAIVSFLEACIYNGLPAVKILRALNHYVPIKANRMVYNTHSSGERIIFLKAIAIRAVLSGESEVDIDAISPKEFSGKKKSHELDNDFKEFKQVIYSLFPWYLLRAKILIDKQTKLLDNAGPVNESSKKARINRYSSHDMLPFEIANVCVDILIFYQQGNKGDITEFYQSFLHNDKAFRLQDKSHLLRAACRIPHLLSIRQPLEHATYELTKTDYSDGPDEIANRYIALARAVLVISSDDASVYFDKAIEISSKFGDELVQRWKAVVALAQRACLMQIVPDELAYRFIRCAELVGENVSREKYWNRSEAIRVSAKMSPGIAISALSRWRDRDIGRFEFQFEALLMELVCSKVISASAGWSLNRFFSNHQLNELLTICLENEPSDSLRQSLVNDAIYLLQIEGTSSAYWDKLREIAVKSDINSEVVKIIADFYAQQKIKSANTDDKPDKVQDRESKRDWDDIFKDLNIATSEGFAALIERFKSSHGKDDYRWSLGDLVKEAVNRVDEKSFWSFIDIIFLSEDVDYYDVQDLLSSMPEKWKGKVSYQARFPEVIYKFGESFAYELTDEYSFNSFKNKLNLDEALTEKLTDGITSGLANGDEIVDAGQFFAFAFLASSKISVQDAAELTDYSLSRFEQHIVEDFGDGPWRKNLHVESDAGTNVAGFIWSALGSPRAAIRWNAAHCVRKLADFNCTDIIDALVQWLIQDNVGAYGHDKFPFYNLHARQYLLIAFARIAIDKPAILRKHSDLFSQYALTQHHVIIQKFASDIIVEIENAFPGTYKTEIILAVNNVGNSNLPVQLEDYQYSTDSYWHKRGEIELGIDFHFGWDFNRYWYEPLGEVFGISSKQIEDLAANLIVKEWKLGERSGYNQDPRVILWNRSDNGRETWHDHGSYPRADNLDFYLSYHSMLVVAARLIQKMPIIKARDYSDDEPLSDWLSGHLLTRPNGRWLADCRDPLPQKRPLWVSEVKKDTWQSEITEEDFLNYMQTETNGELWINVKGGLHEKDNERTETITISTALVSPKTSDALLNALATCSDPYDYKLPYFDEDDMEIESKLFQLKGWINERHVSKGLDQYDPFADEIGYPSYSLGSTIVEKLGLSEDLEGKTWQGPNSSEIVLSCETWSSQRGDRNEEPDQSGMRLKAKLSFLKELCSTLSYDLIFDIGITRDIDYRYDREKREYSKPQHKIFILSADGKLRTTGANYQLG
ncbi:hypothetical protein SAMN04487891_102474 [Flagellimonas taeanensis]|uniref:Nephrocystin 3-like N-terminal domain-containing protein n=1 Tax=Flagellimonas taeanensis TaxID=1005926 RepID=A0A1M6SJI2_9FLAO|nr:hypothetical protein [Allomuricauda taeanensis]SFB81178.1 hypothetical protein SAMN04487891_102474 [Allomuricauda taeanensis]SHK44817.1 hypothetical protein SAMN05216293_1155 [Allomuricauda taeanensis]